jgi:hypothetical protein
MINTTSLAVPGLYHHTNTTKMSTKHIAFRCHPARHIVSLQNFYDKNGDYLQRQCGIRLKIIRRESGEAVRCQIGQ